MVIEFLETDDDIWDCQQHHWDCCQCINKGSKPFDILIFNRMPIYSRSSVFSVGFFIILHNFSFNAHSCFELFHFFLLFSILFQFIHLYRWCCFCMGLRMTFLYFSYFSSFHVVAFLKHSFLLLRYSLTWKSMWYSVYRPWWFYVLQIIWLCKVPTLIT